MLKVLCITFIILATEVKTLTKKSNAVNLGDGAVPTLLFKLALPAIFAQLVNILYNLVDRMYIGHIADIGPMALTGVGVSMPIIVIIMAFTSLVAGGGAPRASIMLGKGDLNEAEKILGNCTAMLLVLSVLLTLFFYRFAEPVLYAFGASNTTLGFAKDYLLIYLLGTVFLQLATGLALFISAQGFTHIAMRATVVGAVLNIVLDPIFIFTFHLNVKGAAIATVISQAVSALYVLRFLTSERSALRLRSDNIRLEKKVILPCLFLGLSPFIMQSTEGLLLVVLNTSLLKYGGDLAVGAMTILSSVRQFIIMPVIGLSQGAQPIVSYNYGALKIERMDKAFKTLIIASVTYTTFVWGMTLLIPEVFVGLFSNNANLIAYAAKALRVYMAVAFVIGPQLACQQTFLALGNAKMSTLMALFRKIILLIPLIYILPHFFDNKVFGVFLAEPIADGIAALTTVILFLYTFKKLQSDLHQKVKSGS